MDFHLPISKNLAYTLWGYKEPYILNFSGWFGDNRPAAEADVVMAAQNQRHEFFMAMVDRFGADEAPAISKQWGILENEIAQWHKHQLKTEETNKVQARYAWFQVQWLLAQQAEMFENKAQISDMKILRASPETLHQGIDLYDKKAMHLLEQMEQIIETQTNGSHAWRIPEYCQLYGQLREIAGFRWMCARRLGEV